MKKRSRLEITVAVLYVLLSVAVLSVTVAYLVHTHFVQKEPVGDLFFFTLFFLLLAVFFTYSWWKDEKVKRRCKQYALGKIVDRRYVRTGRIAGYAPVVRFDANGRTMTVAVNIVNESNGKSVNCTVGDDYHLMYNEEDPTEIIPCSSDADTFMKINKIAAIVFHVLFLIAFLILLCSF